MQVTISPKVGVVVGGCKQAVVDAVMACCNQSLVALQHAPSCCQLHRKQGAYDGALCRQMRLVVAASTGWQVFGIILVGKLRKSDIHAQAQTQMHACRRQRGSSTPPSILTPQMHKSTHTHISAACMSAAARLEQAPFHPDPTNAKEYTCTHQREHASWALHVLVPSPTSLVPQHNRESAPRSRLPLPLHRASGHAKTENQHSNTETVPEAMHLRLLFHGVY